MILTYRVEFQAAAVTSLIKPDFNVLYLVYSGKLSSESEVRSFHFPPPLWLI